MDTLTPTITIENGLNLQDLLMTGSILHINEEYYEEVYSNFETDTSKFTNIGQPVLSFEKLAQTMINVDEKGLVKKKIIENGGGMPLNEEFTVSIAYSGYWENEAEPFDVAKEDKPLVVDIKDNGLLPGFQIAIKSLLVGELAIFLFSYEVMYGEMGVPPRIKPKSDCVFYIRLLKSIVTPKHGPIKYSESNMFHKVQREVNLLYTTGVSLHSNKNYNGAIHHFKKSISLLHHCQLADENEEAKQEKLLIKLYMNLAVCYNKIKQPLKACTACNELNRLNNLWNNSKALFQNAKSLRMIGDFSNAEKKIRRSMNLDPDNKEIKEEFELLLKTRDACNQNSLIDSKRISAESINDKFKQEVDNLIQSFKTNDNLCKLTLPFMLNSDEVVYVKDTCKRNNLFLNKIEKNYLLDRECISGEIDDDMVLGKCSLFDNKLENA